MKKIIIILLALASVTSMVYADENDVLQEAVENVQELMDVYVDLDAEQEKENKKENAAIEKEPYIVEEQPDCNYIDILTALGIAEGEENMQKLITRSEFAHYLYLLGGIQNVNYYSGNMGFTDIEEVSNKKEINAVAAKGYMTGYDDSVFCPDKPISTNEAVCAILRMAGYKIFAEQCGGYPDGYLKCAFEQRLLKNVISETELTYANLTKILYNALFVPIVEIKSALSLSEGISYDIDNEKNLLLQNFKTERIKGQLTATEYASVNNKVVSQGQIMINVYGEDLIFSTNTEMEDILGFNGYFYIYDKESVLAYEIIEGKNKSVKINGGGILSVNKALTEIKAVTEDKGSEQAYKINPKADFIYNGKNCYEVTCEDIQNINGMIRLIDYNCDNYYDIVYIWNFETYFADSILIENSIINDKKVGRFIELDDEKYDVRFYKFGKKADFSVIQKNDVLLVAKTREETGNLITVYISSYVIEGTVEFISEDEIRIDGTNYKISSDLNRDSISVGTKALFGLNHMNEICCFDKIYTSKKEYAYLLDCFTGDGDEEDRIYLKVYSENNSIEKIKVAEKFYVNNEKSTLNGLISLIGEENGVTKQLIAIQRNSIGEIKHIYISGDSVPYAKETANYRLTFNKKYAGHRIRRVSIMGEYVTNDQTKMFVIVSDPRGEFVENASGVYDRTNCPVEDAYRPTTMVYDAYEDLCAGAIIFNVSQTDYAKMIGGVSTFSFLVNSVASESDENNDIIVRVSGYISGSEVNYILDDTMDISDWRKGDIRMISTLKKSNKIGSSRQFFGLENLSGKSPDNILYADTDYSVYPAFYNLTESSDNTSQESPMYGTIMNISADSPSYVSIKLEDNSGLRVANIASHSKFYKYDRKNGFSAVTKDQIIRGKKAYIMTRYGNIMELVMFE